MKLKDFIETFSHNNEIWIENRYHKCLEYRYRTDLDYVYDVIMDWELQYTDIADFQVIEISNVIGHTRQGITIVVDTSAENFEFLPELVTEDNCPIWLYEKVHNTKVQVGESC